MKARHQWTKDEIKALVSLWDTKTTLEIAAELNLKNNQVTYMAKRVRDSGYALPKHRRNGYMASLVKEAIAELKIKKS